MRDLKRAFFTLLLTILLLPIGMSYAQEEEIPLEEDETLMYQSGTPEEEYEVTIQQDVAEEEPILYEDTDYDYNYEFDTEQFNEMFESLPSDTVEEGVAAGLFAVMAAYSIFIAVFGLAGYIFTALAFQKIGKEMNYENSWFAWVPILQSVMMFELGGQNPWLLLLFLIPGIGQLIVLIFTFLALMKITEKRGYDKVLAALIFVPMAMYVLFYLLAWKPKEVTATPTPVQPVPEAK